MKEKDLKEIVDLTKLIDKACKQLTNKTTKSLKGLDDIYKADYVDKADYVWTLTLMIKNMAQDYAMFLVNSDCVPNTIKDLYANTMLTMSKELTEICGQFLVFD